MAISITLDRNATSKSSNKLNTIGTGNLGAYATGGVAVTANKLGLGRIDNMQVEPAAGYVFSFNKTNLKVLAHYADYDAVADGALIEVPNTTDITAAVFRWTATGY